MFIWQINIVILNTPDTSDQLRYLEPVSLLFNKRQYDALGYHGNMKAFHKHPIFRLYLLISQK